MKATIRVEYDDGTVDGFIVDQDSRKEFLSRFNSGLFAIKLLAVAQWDKQEVGTRPIKVSK